MKYLPKIAWISVLAAAFVFSSSSTIAAQNAQIRHVGVRKSGGTIQIEIETSKRVVPLTQVVTDPDRLVIDFADAVPGPELRTVAVSDGAVKGVRIGRVTANPPVTRIVVDLKSPQPFQLFPSSKSVIVKVGDGASAPAVAAVAPKEAEAAPEQSAVAPPATAPVQRTASLRLAVAPAPSAMSSKPATLRITPAMTTPDAETEISISRAPMPAGASAQIRHVAMLKSGGATEIEIETSQRVEPSVQAITGPDRLVIDFPQSTPGPQLRAMAVNQGVVKGVRVALLSAKPPVTRVVLDLKSAQAYQIFPTAKSVIVKLPDSAGNGPGPLSSPQIAAVPPTPPPVPKKVEILFQGGKLSVTSNKASLAEVLNELRVQTGADIAVPPGAEQEVVAVMLGPASPREVISKLLDGSRYNFIIVGTDQDANQVERVILSPKSAANMPAESRPPISESVPVAQMQGSDRSNGAPPPAPPPPTEDVQPQGDSAAPDTTPQPGDPQAAPN